MLKKKKKNKENIEKKFGKFKNGIVVSFGDTLQIKSLDESQAIKDQIMSILFEDDKNAEEKSSDNKSESQKLPLEESVRAAFDLLCKNAGLSDEQHGKVYAFKYNDKALNESDDSKKSIDMKNVEDAFKSKLRTIAGKGAEKGILAFVGKIDEVKSKLAEHKLDNSKFDKYKKDFQYVAVHLPKMPDKEKFPTAHSTGTEYKSSIGYKNFTKASTIQSLKDALNDKIGKNIEFIKYEKIADNVKGDKNRSYRYNKTKIPAKFSVRAIFFNVNESDDGGEEPIAPGKDNPETYLMPFGGKEIDDSVDVNVNADVDSDISSEDLYIVPIPNMNYKDKEYDTYA